MMKICVCIPFYSEFETAKPGLRELEACKEIEFVIKPGHAPCLPVLRNKLINEGKSQQTHQTPPGDYDGFLMIDSDIGFTLDDALEVINSGKKICGGAYRRHCEDAYECGVFKTDMPGAVYRRFETGRSGMHEVDFIGAGFLYIQTSALLEMEYPWFRCEVMKIAEDRKEIYGSDIGFCMNASSAGIEIWCSFDVSLHHAPRKMDISTWALNERITVKKNPDELIKEYYAGMQQAQSLYDKRQAQVIAVTELMQWNAEYVNKLLGANVLAPAPAASPEKEKTPVD